MSIQSNQKILRLLAAALFALALAACGSSPVSEDADAPQAEADSQEQAAAQAEARAEAERQAAAERAEAERRAAQAEAERQAAEAAAQAEREAAEAAERAEAEREAAERELAEQAARAEAEREAAAEAERGAAEAAAAAEAERQAAQAAAEAEAERQAAQAAAEAEAERRAANARAAQASTAGSGVADSSAASGVIARTPENIARLGNELTPMGSPRAGNAAGTIPAWDGGLTREDWPAGYSPGDRHPNPFPDDRPQFVITGENYQEYADQLSVGQIATFERYPETYFMRVYPSRRSASFPERTYEMSIANASTAELVANGEGIEDAAEGFPFPIPQNAYQLMWNHKLKYKGIGGTRYNNQVAPTTSGAYQLVKLREEILGLYYKEGMTIEDTNNILLYFFQEVESPARLAGNILLVHETLNQIAQPRQAWIYNPGQRRVRRAPNVAYDNPGTASDGLRTNDMTDMFNGAMDRFDWEVVGKKEMYVPYNSYDAHTADVTTDDLVMAGHLNPEYMRYELHRVWIIDARLKEGTRHINSRRTYYLDEDSYQILLTDHYDQRGELWRASEAHSINYYDVPTFWTTLETHMDLLSGRYVAVGLDNQDPVNTFNVELSPSNYTPQALRTRGRR